MIDVAGRPIRLCAAEFLFLFRLPRTWRYLVMVFGVLLAADPAAVGDRLPPTAYVLAWLFGISCYFVSQTVLMLGIAVLRRSLPPWPVYWPIVSLLALAPTLSLLDRGLESLLDVCLWPLLLSKMLYLLVVIGMFETIFMRFVFSPAPSEAAAESPQGDGPPVTGPQPAAAEAPDRGRMLLLAAQPVPLAEIIYLEARQHHVCAALTGGNLTLRTRLADVLAQTTPEDGVQTHRSWWVARQAVAGLESWDGKPIIRLRNGASVPVARSRLAEVERWLATHGPEPAN
ncbi:LytTR family DNA-binding domain-containing protein [Salipiger mangrovisoli]|uniref:LytTR family DNA-binding domain-containing protein n=1 Tax=Salipiger mangrovisoli TaxID=2865933 RepID=UPI00187F79F4|nr:LytTR family DNA-binding domain-containing protein [Salipiger mangrovisoli]